MRLRMLKGLVAAALLFPLTSTLVADDAVGDLNATASRTWADALSTGPVPAAEADRITIGSRVVTASEIVSPLAYGYALILKTILHPFITDRAGYEGGVAIPEAALLALLGAALLAFSKLLRKKLRRS